MNANDLRERLGLGADWEERRQITLIEPAKNIAVEGQEPKAAPRSNIVLSLVTNTRGQTTQEARDEFVEKTAAAVPGLDVMDKSDVRFADGANGSQALVGFYAVPGTKLRQTHLFRIDGEIVAQIVVTVDDEIEPEREDGLIAAALKYKPDTLTPSD